VKNLILVILLLVPLSLSTKQISIWKYDWRLNDIKRSELFIRENLQTKCLFGYLYYTYKGTPYTIPVLDWQENIVRCKDKY
jgi:hypothetical protein